MDAMTIAALAGLITAIAGCITAIAGLVRELRAAGKVAERHDQKS
jgi:hypothetical protein